MKTIFFYRQKRKENYIDSTITYTIHISLLLKLIFKNMSTINAFTEIFEA